MLNGHLKFYLTLFEKSLNLKLNALLFNKLLNLRLNALILTIFYTFIFNFLKVFGIIFLDN